MEEDQLQHRYTRYGELFRASQPSKLEPLEY